MILHSLQTNAESGQPEFEIGLAVVKNAASVAMRVRIPRALLARIGEPERVRFSGRPTEGFTISPAKGKEGSLKINYRISGQSVYLMPAFRPMKLSKTLRRMTAVKARLDGNVIKVSGPPPGWINATREFVDGEPPAAHIRLAASPMNGSIPIKPNGHDAAPPVPPSSPTAPVARSDLPKVEEYLTVDELRARLEVTLRQAASLKLALERKTHLKLKIDQGFRLFVDLEGPPNKT